MKRIQYIGFIAAVIMGSTIGYGLIFGNFFVDGAQLMGNPWGIVSLIDIYVAMFLFASWMVWREMSWKVILWIVAFIGLGSLGVALYVLRTAWLSTTFEEFFLGKGRAHPRA